MDAQVKKGLIDVCVLAVLRKGDSYGWQVIKDIGEVMEVSESTLYPVLKRLELGGLIRSYEQPYNGRLRKYFHLTPAGNVRLQLFEHEHEQLALVHNFILSSIKEGGVK